MKNQEKKNMIDILWQGILLIAGFAGIVIIITKFSNSKDEKNRINASSKKPEIANSDKSVNASSITHIESSEKDRTKWSELYNEKGRLEQTMVRLTGGSNGMSELKMRFQNLPKEDNRAKMYRETFFRKQKELAVAYHRYQEILMEARQCPEDMRRLFGRLKDEELYKELLEFPND